MKSPHGNMTLKQLLAIKEDYYRSVHCVEYCEDEVEDLILQHQSNETKYDKAFKDLMHQGEQNVS